MEDQDDFRKEKAKQEVLNAIIREYNASGFEKIPPEGLRKLANEFEIIEGKKPKIDEIDETSIPTPNGKSFEPRIETSEEKKAAFGRTISIIIVVSFFVIVTLILLNSFYNPNYPVTEVLSLIFDKLLIILMAIIAYYCETRSRK